ncbi:TetR/AcrR family transcriptional regulator [Flindersiella endophytica]
MPRVSPEHLEARRRQIMDAARICFSRNGFHATSMQDIFAEAQLSAGATYRYFKSKEEIIGAIATDLIGHLGQTFSGVFESEEPLPLHEAFLRIGQTFEQLDSEFGVAKIAVQVWAEAVRSPALRDQMGVLIGGMRDLMAELVVYYQERGEIGPGDPQRIGRVLLALWPGFILQYAIFEDIDAESFASGLRSLLQRGKVTSG